LRLVVQMPLWYFDKFEV